MLKGISHTHLMHLPGYFNALLDELGDAQGGLLLVYIGTHIEQILFDDLTNIMKIGRHSCAGLLGCLLLLAFTILLTVILVIAVLHKNGLPMDLTKQLVGVIVVAKDDII